MGRWQPYLYNANLATVYDPPEVFNPKAVTMASRQPPPKKKEKEDGPLVNVNRHPDSYLMLPYGKTGAKPMNPKVKTWIKIARWIQLFFRVLTLIGAIGTLLCAIFLRGVSATEGYMIRIPPGVDLINCLYAIYHLLRAAKARPAGSSASYHFFSLVMDAGFIPFYVFTALLSKRNYNEGAGTEGRWRTFFPTDEETDKVLQTIWLTATTVGALHIASLVLDLYLLIIFRQISRLPPDMNPLEENLTSRRKTKHKHKTSSMSAITPLTAEEKRFSAQSGASTLIGNRNSAADPLISEKGITAPDASKMAFLHTRSESNMTYSPHTPNSARHSRSLYSQPASAVQSRANLNSRDDLHRRDDEDENETLAQRKELLAQQAIKRNSRPQSMVSSKQDYYTPPATAEERRNSDDIAGQLLQSDNWVVHGETTAEADELANERRLMFPSRTKQGYNSVAMYDDVSDEEYDRPLMPQPLRMNPPTPQGTPPPSKTSNGPPSPQKDGSPSKSRPTSSLQRTNTVVTLSSDATFTRSPSRAGTLKTRYYGDLKAATSSIRGGNNTPTQSPLPSPTKTPNHLPSSTKMYTSNSPIVPKSMTTSPFSLDKKTFSSVRRTGEAGHTPIKAQSPRVVSRTGVDYDGRYDFEDDSDLGTPGRRRDVSGKIAEEGRGGGFGQAGGWGLGRSELTYRKVSGVA